jgi:hypothetical protein
MLTLKIWIYIWKNPLYNALFKLDYSRLNILNSQVLQDSFQRESRSKDSTPKDYTNIFQ